MWCWWSRCDGRALAPPLAGGDTTLVHDPDVHHRFPAGRSVASGAEPPGVTGPGGGMAGRGRGAESQLYGTHRSGRSCGPCGRRDVVAGGSGSWRCGPGVDRDVDGVTGLLTGDGSSHRVHRPVTHRPPAAAAGPQPSTGPVDNRGGRVDRRSGRARDVHRVSPTRGRPRRVEGGAGRIPARACDVRQCFHTALWTTWGQACAAAGAGCGRPCGTRGAAAGEVRPTAA